jgi:HlyD family secretion protein
MAMDVKRDPAILRRKRMRQMVLGGVAVVVLLGVTYFVMKLKPAAPLVDSEPWKDTVKRGDFVREVRGAGTLVPEDIRWIPARTCSSSSCWLTSSNCAFRCATSASCGATCEAIVL